MVIPCASSGDSAQNLYDPAASILVEVTQVESVGADSARKLPVRREPSCFTAEANL